MSEPIYLLTGVTGRTGGAAASELRRQGHRVRGLVHKDDARAEALRTLGVETIMGDLLDLDSIRRAMEGVAGAYFVYPIPDGGLIDAAAFTAQTAVEAGVQSLVNMSQKSARREAKSHAARDHWVSERVFDWSGVPTTHIRPTFFAEWLLYPRPGWQVKNGVIRFPLGRHRVGLHIVLFEDCSAFTHVAACTLARSPIRDPLSEGFRHFVASMPAPVASGWSDFAGWALHPLESAALSRRTPDADFP